MKTTRRDIIKAAALGSAAIGGVHWPLARAVSSLAQSAHSLTFAPRAFVIDGKPVYLVMGSVDYFRCPHELWPDVLLRAKRSGLNAIAFCVAWNFHEREEGVFNFSGDADIGQFLDVCQQLGLYAFPRVGPFVCDEWDAGGHPAWLYAKKDVELRTDHAPTLAYVERWFDKLIPILAERQVTRGGPVLLVQQENEYYFVGRPHVQEYQGKLIRMLRDRGIDVPVTDCNGSRAETRVANSFMTQNSGGAHSVELIHKIQPDKPAVISELYTDYMNMWGWPITSYPTSALIYQQTVETLAAGGMYNYFMSYVCTNFGFWASSTWKSDESFVTTRYYARAPIAEGGGLNESYWVTKAVNQLARGAERFLTRGEAAELPVTLAGPVRGVAVRAPEGYLLFVQPEFPEKVESVYHTDGQSGPLIQTGEDRPFVEIANQSGTLQLPSGERFQLAEPSSYPSMIPYGLQLDSDNRIDFCNATFLGLTGKDGRRVLYIRGEALRPGLISVNGQRLEFVFKREQPLYLKVGNLSVVALSRELSDRTWFLDRRVIIGPYYVGQENQDGADCYFDAASNRVYILSLTGAVRERDIPVPPVATLTLAFDNWHARPLPEILVSREGWRALDSPRGVEELGSYWGYSWYRAEINSDRERSTGLLFTEAADRLIVFANGQRCGTWGRGRDAIRDPVRVQLRSGRNEFVFLCDNMGRLSEGALPDRKGIRGPVYVDARVQPLPRPKWLVPDAAPSASWMFQTYREYSRSWSLSAAASDAKSENLHYVSYELNPNPGEGLKLALLSLPQYAWVVVNGQVVGEHAGDLSLAGGISFSSFVLDAHLGPGKTRLDLVFYGEVPTDLDAHVRLYAYPKTGQLENWGFRPWTDPTSEGSATPGHPTWWETDFARPAVAGPFFLAMEGLTKGQVYLNGKALGRYWEIGPQHTLYVPDPWLQPRNRLVIFDESGARPHKVYLTRDSRVPVSSVRL